MKLSPLTLFSTVLLAASATVHASPFTFQFDLPDWESTSDSAVFGTNAVLDVTVDNGTASDIGQSYLNSQITRIEFTAVGGSFSETWTTGLNGCLTCSYFSTNNSGIPTLDLLAGPAASTDLFAQGPDESLFQLGVFQTSYGGFVPVYLDNGDYQVAQYLGPSNANGGHDTGFEVTGTLAGASAPEPGSLALLAAGLIGLLAMSRRRRSRS
jgi:hypothetical protein